MKPSLLLLRALRVFVFCSVIAAGSAATPVTTALVGKWHLDPARSTELSPWKTFHLTITLAGDTVTLERRLAWGRRDFTDRLVLDTTQPETVATIDWWADTRHLGAYLGADHSRRVHPQWLDAGRIRRDPFFCTPSSDRTASTGRSPVCQLLSGPAPQSAFVQ